MTNFDVWKEKLDMLKAAEILGYLGQSVGDCELCPLSRPYNNEMVDIYCTYKGTLRHCTDRIWEHFHKEVTNV